MCGSMVDIQFATAEIRRGKKKRRKKIEITGQKYNGLPCYIGQTINSFAISLHFVWWWLCFGSFTGVGPNKNLFCCLFAVCNLVSCSRFFSFALSITATTFCFCINGLVFRSCSGWSGFPCLKQTLIFVEHVLYTLNVDRRPVSMQWARSTFLHSHLLYES